uniref:Uncharacterized protein n=1 Tax=Sus scrofa TaxID=9823 RepID=A0A4X1VD92_PIG
QEKKIVKRAGNIGFEWTTMQLFQNHFLQIYSPELLKEFRKHVTLRNSTRLVLVIDYAGTEVYCQMREQYKKMSKGSECLFSLNNVKYYQEINHYRKRIPSLKNSTKVSTVLEGKSHLFPTRTIDTLQSHLLGRSHGIRLLKISAKFRKIIESAFWTLVTTVKQLNVEKIGRKKKTSGKVSVQKCIFL